MNCGAIHVYALVNPKDRLLFSLLPTECISMVHQPPMKTNTCTCNQTHADTVQEVYLYRQELHTINSRSVQRTMSASFHSNTLISKALVINGGAAHTDNRQSHSTIETKRQRFSRRGRVNSSEDLRPSITRRRRRAAVLSRSAETQ